LVVGYRGRPLPIQYGKLGFEKVEIGRLVKAYCLTTGITHDIAWDETSRIYGPAWYDFMSSCRSMLGSESGSNVFDWDGNLAGEIACYKKQRPRKTDSQAYLDIVKARELPGLMNQISPRVFEAISLRTALVLFEGSYSNVVMADKHFIPLMKDGGNLVEVFEKLRDGNYLDALTDRAYQDVIVSERYSYATFVHMVDAEIEVTQGSATRLPIFRPAEPIVTVQPTVLTLRPIRSNAPIPDRSLKSFLWRHLPEDLRDILRPLVRKILRRDR